MKISFSSLIIAAASIVSSVAVPAKEGSSLLQARAGTPSAEGTHSGYFYSWWTDNGGTATYTNEEGGRYSLQWSGNGNLVGGKGWNPGTETRYARTSDVYRRVVLTGTFRVISYNGTYTPNGNSYLAVYGWTRNALIEYYVVESYGTYNPASAAGRKGTVTCNGGTYDILSTWRNNQPSIDGTKTFQQFWSVRTPKKNPGGAISGTVDTKCHFDAWRKVGMSLGTSHYYQIVATEGYFSSGRSTITVT